jgi:hypothetical protein
MVLCHHKNILDYFILIPASYNATNSFDKYRIQYISHDLDINTDSLVPPYIFFHLFFMIDWLVFNANFSSISAIYPGIFFYVIDKVLFFLIS